MTELLKMPHELGPNDLLARQLFDSLSVEKRIETILQGIREAGRDYRDKPGVSLVELLGKVVMGQEHLIETEKVRRHFGEASERAKRRLSEYASYLYWDLPDAQEHLGAYISDPVRHSATMVETKLALLGFIVNFWTKTVTPESQAAFRFLIVAAHPFPNTWQKREGESETEMRARGRKTFQEEREKIYKLIRDWTVRWDPEDLEPWIQESHLPSEIQKILIVARARNGGEKLVKRDLRFAEILQPLDPLQRSEAALKYCTQFFREVVSLDAKLQDLKNQMQPPERFLTWAADREVGQSELVLGTIEFEISSLNSVTVRIILQDDCSPELGHDITGRAMRHLRKWLDEFSSVTVFLEVNGGQGKSNFRWQMAP